MNYINMSPTPGVRSVATQMVLSSISLFLFLSLLLVSDKVLHKASTERLQSFLRTSYICLWFPARLLPLFFLYCMAPGGLLSSSSLTFWCPGHCGRLCDPAVVHGQSSSIFSSFFLFLLFFSSFLDFFSFSKSESWWHICVKNNSKSLDYWFQHFWIPDINVIIQLLLVYPNLLFLVSLFFFYWHKQYCRNYHTC